VMRRLLRAVLRLFIAACVPSAAIRFESGSQPGDAHHIRTQSMVSRVRLTVLRDTNAVTTAMTRISMTIAR